MKDFDINERVNQALLNFRSGYNCAQSVFLAYCDIFEMDIDMAKNVSAGFGGGLGRMREVCGTVSAMSMLAGFKYPVTDSTDQLAKKKNYQIIQKMAEQFKEKNGTIICRTLLENIKTNPSPASSSRSAEGNGGSRPCSKLVEDAAIIAGKMLKGEFDK